jgi:hypothetical protein
MPLSLQGCLYLILNQQQIKVECTGQSIKLIFSSFRSVMKFVHFLTASKDEVLFRFIKKELSELNLTYYLNDFIIGQSKSDLKPTWLGGYFGLEKSAIYPRQILNYFLRGLKK